MSDYKATPEQEAEMIRIRDEMIEVGLCTEPSDFSASREFVKMAYMDAKCDPPAEFLEMDGPLEAELYIRRKGWATSRLYGSMEVGWLTRYVAMGLFGVDITPLRGLIGLAKNCGWINPYDRVCILQHRAAEFHFDRPILKGDDFQEPLLHRDDGPAILYRDGFKVYAIDGVGVPENVVMEPESQTFDEIVNESNEEVRAIRINRLGHEKFFSMADGKPVDRRRNEIEGTREQLWKCKGNFTFLRTYCPSQMKIYHLPVDDSITTCAEAQRWLWNFPPGTDANAIIKGRT